MAAHANFTAKTGIDTGARGYRGMGVGFPATSATNATASLGASAARGGDRAVRVQQSTVVGVPITDRAQRRRPHR